MGTEGSVESRYASAILGLAQTYGVDLGVSVWAPGMDRPVGVGQHRRFPLASVTKLIVAVAALWSHERKQMNRSIPWDDLFDLIRAAVSRHDRHASAVLTELAGGTKAIGQVLGAQGFTGLGILDDHAALDNSGTPHDLTLLLKRLVTHSLLGDAGSEVLLQSLRQQRDPDGLLSGLPSYCHWAHMTGGLNGVCNDMGVLSCGDGLLVCAVCIQGNGDWSRLNQAAGDVGAATFEHFLAGRAS